jgi:hypothetical protein
VANKEDHRKGGFMRIRGLVIFIGLIVVLSTLAVGQSLEEIAKQRISENTGLDPDLIATLFVTREEGEFILAFIYITDRTFDSSLKEEIKRAIMPYRNKKAMLVLVTPTKASYFNPFRITFTQLIIRDKVEFGEIKKITDNFRAGTLESGVVSAGIVLLDEQIDVRRPFKISYLNHTTIFELGNPSPQPPDQGSLRELLLLLNFIFFHILTFLLLPFLI